MKQLNNFIRFLERISKRNIKITKLPNKKIKPKKGAAKYIYHKKRIGRSSRAYLYIVDNRGKWYCIYRRDRYFIYADNDICLKVLY